MPKQCSTVLYFYVPLGVLIFHMTLFPSLTLYGQWIIFRGNSKLDTRTILWHRCNAYIFQYTQIKIKVYIIRRMLIISIRHQMWSIHISNWYLYFRFWLYLFLPSFVITGCYKWVKTQHEGWALKWHNFHVLGVYQTWIHTIMKTYMKRHYGLYCYDLEWNSLEIFSLGCDRI